MSSTQALDEMQTLQRIAKNQETAVKSPSREPIRKIGWVAVIEIENMRRRASELRVKEMRGPESKKRVSYTWMSR